MAVDPTTFPMPLLGSVARALKDGRPSAAILDWEFGFTEALKASVTDPKLVPAPLPADVPRLTSDGRPTPQLLDWEWQFLTYLPTALSNTAPPPPVLATRSSHQRSSPARPDTLRKESAAKKEAPRRALGLETGGRPSQGG